MVTAPRENDSAVVFSFRFPDLSGGERKDAAEPWNSFPRKLEMLAWAVVAVAANGGTLILRCVFLLTACLVLTVPAWSGHTLSSQERQVLKSWLARHSEYRPG